MKDRQVYENLCSKDRRNPLWDDIYGWDDQQPQPVSIEDRMASKSGCFCDNCFYGRDRLALEILKLKEELSHAKVRKTESRLPEDRR